MTDNYYGSSIADLSLTTACDMAKNATGGIETNKTETISGVNQFAEITSQGLIIASVTVIPAAPTGNGWVIFLGAGSIGAGNWTDIVTLSFPALHTPQGITTRAFKLPGGVLGSAILIGSIGAFGTLVTAKTTYTSAATAFGAAIFVAGDALYIDRWFQDSGVGGAGSDNPTVYESNSSSVGVTNDAQIIAPVFVPVVVTPSINPIVPGAVLGPSISNQPLWRNPSQMGPVQGRRAIRLYGYRGLVGKHPFKKKWGLF